MVRPVLAHEIERLVALSHHDPHAVLGAHPAPEGTVVRAFRPDAERVAVLLDGTAPRDAPPIRIPMARRHEEGVFEALIEGAREVPPYRLEIALRSGETLVAHDPYSFLPALGELDLHLFAEGRHERLWEKLGARAIELRGVPGTAFAVWAPNARGVSVVGDWNRWDGRIHPMRSLGASGIWELFVPGVGPGARYKFEVRPKGGGPPLLKADPCARAAEVPPATASIVERREHRFRDEAWLVRRARGDLLRRPLSIYEVHLASWRRVPEEGNRPLRYREIAPLLSEYAADMGFTHVEFMPVMEHPFGPSWGYQVTSYFAPTARLGTPDDLRFLIDALHEKGIGVILDWVPAHFPKDAWALGRFDGTALYEHLDPREGEHPDWGTFVFNFGRNEVRNFLLASALYWLEEFHADGLRVDAVASMLYRDYSRRAGEWIPNRFGGRENLEAIQFLKELNEAAHRLHPGVLMIAEESTAWPGVSRPTWLGGLGFGYKWNMGWMHDTLRYFSKDPIHRRYHHGDLTFGLLYAWSENFILPLSHDEVVHGKRSLINKMPGDRWQKFANMRALFAHMWAHPGKKLLMMGGEIGQWAEWNHERSLDWHLLAEADHRGLSALVRDLNRAYRAEPALWEADYEPQGFQWIDCSDADANVISFARAAPSSGRRLVCVGNFSPVVRRGYRVGLPLAGGWREVINTDALVYGGSNVGNMGRIEAEARPWHGQPCSAALTLPPLGVLWLVPENP
jgi:1,4-alpha-glucan branching enzyme